MSELIITLIIINTIYVITGIFYAWQIYLAPSPHGWTFVSVGVGFGIVLFAMMFNSFVLFHFQIMAINYHLASLGLTVIGAGLPMIIGQAIKKYREDNKNKKLLDGDSGKNLD